MNKTELTAAVAKRAGITLKTAEQSVNAFFDIVGDTVASGEKIAIIGFGSWERVERPAREGKNPFNGEPYKVPATYVPKFKASDTFKKAVAAQRRPAA